MIVVDFTHLIEEDMPVFMGTEGPSLTEANTYSEDGFKETKLSFFSHTGTHMDAPLHIFENSCALDEMPAEQFVGAALIVDYSHLTSGQQIGLKEIDAKRKLADEADFLLFYTGWSRYWGSEEYFGDFPCLDEEVLDYVINSNKKGIGFDTISLDPIQDENLTMHKKLLATNQTVIIENLCNLQKGPEGLFTFCGLPLKYIHADGAPIRAIGMFSKEDEVE